MPAKPKIVIVDTNCYVRLYASPIRPILGTVVAGYQLLTLEELRLEVRPNTSVSDRNAWLQAKDIQNDLANAVLRLREPKASKITKAAKVYRTAGDKILRVHCLAEKTEVPRQLSGPDARALATALELDAALATDEWPLRLVASTMFGGPGGLELLSSVGILHMMLLAGVLTAVQCAETMRLWCVSGEALPRGARDEYQQRFGANAPDGQSASSQRT